MVENVDESKNDRVIQEAGIELHLFKDHTFYNEAQTINRDISLLATYGFVKNMSKKTIKYLDATSASGIRALRTGRMLKNMNLDVPASIIACDMNEDATKIINHNIATNDLSDIVEGKCCDSIKFLDANDQLYDIIDVDPYGTCEPFIDSVLKKSSDGSLLCLTSTDMRVLSGASNQIECYRRYGSSVPRVMHCIKEIAIRILLNCIMQRSLKFNVSIEPLLSLSIDHYIRVFVRVTHSAEKSIANIHKSGYILYCRSCTNIRQELIFNEQSIFASKINCSSTCDICDSKLLLGGPLWLGPIHDDLFLKEMHDSIDSIDLVNKDRVGGIISTLVDEIKDCPFVYNALEICKRLRTNAVKFSRVYNALENLGHSVSMCLAEPSGIKTDADFKTFINIVRYFSDQPTKKTKFDDENSNELKVYTALTSELILEDFSDNYLDREKFEKQKKNLNLSQKQGKQRGPLAAV